MTQVDITFKNGTERHYTTTQTQEAVYADARKLAGISRLEVHEAQVMWPTAKDCPVFA